MNTKDKVYGLAAALFMQTASAATYNDMIFFGDSLTDSGTYLPLLQLSDPSYAGTGKFTNTPGLAWSENIAQDYGFTATPASQNGSNYAQGGARIEGEGYSFSNAMPLTTQISTYLTSVNGQANPNALYSSWIGGNDFLWILEGNVATSDLPSYITSMLSNNIGALSTLQAAGAQYIVVPSVPDLTNTPTSAFLTPTEAAQLSALIKSYNKQLYSQAALLGLKIIPADVDTLFSEIQDSPTTYGFTNVSSPLCPSVASSLYCIEGITYTAGDELTYAFADFAHPTSAGHTLISDYIGSILEAPAFAQQAASIITGDLNTQQQNIHSMLRNPQSANSDRSSLWLDAGTATDTDKNNSPSLRMSLGILNSNDKDGFFGAALHLSDNELKSTLGKVQNQSIGVSLFSRIAQNQLSLNTSLMVSSGDIDLRRNVSLYGANRALRSNTSSLGFSAQGEINYAFTASKITHGPILGLRHQYLMIDDFQESSTDGSTSTSMQYSDQTLEDTTVYAGWHLTSLMDSTSIRPYLDLTWQYKANTDHDDLKVALLDLPNNTFSTPTTSEDDKSYGLLEAGISWEMSSNVSIQTRMSYLFENKDSSNLTGNVSALFKF